MAIAGRIEYEITVDKSGLTKGLNDAKKETKSFAEKLQDAGKTGAKALGKTVVAGAVAASTAIVKMTKDAIQSYAEFEQLSGGIEAMFGGMEQGYEQIAKVNEYASNAWQKLTMSQNEYFESFSSSYPLMKADIEDENEAIEATNRLLKLNSDLSNTFGYSIEQASTAVNWALKGSFNYIDNLNLGIKGTQEGFLEAAHSVGYMVDDVKDLKSEDILTILEKYAEKFGVIDRTANEALGTIQGSLKMMRASWSNLMTGIVDDGADFDKLMENFTTSAGAFGKNILPKISTAVKGIVKIIGTLVPEIIKILPDIIAELLPAIVEATNSLILALVENMPALIQTLLDALPAILQGIMQLFQGIIDNLPMFIEAITQLILGIVQMLLAPENLKAFLKAGITLGTQLILAIPDILVALIDALPDIIDGIVEFLTDPENLMLIIEGAVKLFMGIVMAVPRILGALFEAFGKLIGNLWNRLTQLFKDFAGNFGETVSNIFKGAVNGVLWFIEQFLNGPIDILNFFVDAINGVLGAVSGGTAQIGKIPRIQLPRLASGGIVESANGGQLILAGEGGQDEWVVPESKMADMIQKINEQGGTGGGITINIQGVFATSDAEQRAVAEQIYDKLQEINKSRMGAYL